MVWSGMKNKGWHGTTCVCVDYVCALSLNPKPSSIKGADSEHRLSPWLSARVLQALVSHERHTALAVKEILCFLGRTEKSLKNMNGIRLKKQRLA